MFKWIIRLPHSRYSFQCDVNVGNLLVIIHRLFQISNVFSPWFSRGDLCNRNLEPLISFRARVLNLFVEDVVDELQHRNFSEGLQKLPKEVLKISQKSQATFQEASIGAKSTNVAFTGFYIEFDTSNACAVLTTVVLFLHQQIQFIQLQVQE